MGVDTVTYTKDIKNVTLLWGDKMEIIYSKPEKIQFSDFYSMYHEKVVRYIGSKIGNFHDAEDLASEVFTYCYHHYDSYDPARSALSTWLYLVVNSRIKNYYRDAKTYVDLESLVGVLPDESIDMEKCVYLQQLKEMLQKAMEVLPERQRKIVTLRYFEEKSNVEIAEELGMTHINVRVQLSRALDTLEKKFGDTLKGAK